MKMTVGTTEMWITPETPQDAVWLQHILGLSGNMVVLKHKLEGFSLLSADYIYTEKREHKVERIPATSTGTPPAPLYPSTCEGESK